MYARSSIRCIHLFLCLCAGTAFLFPWTPTGAEVPIRGEVRLPSGAPAADARVAIIEAKTAVTTDADGRFTLSVPTTGFYSFRIIHQENITQRRIEVRYADQTIIIDLRIESREQAVTQGIEVVGLRDKTKLSRYRLTGDEMKRLPGVYGDSLKAINTLPGVSPAVPTGALPSVNILSTSFLSGFSVGPPYRNSTTGILTLRGAGPRANQFYLDGFRILYPFHLGDQSSVINNDFIRAVDVYTGSFPARFGDATGGIIAIEGPSKADKPGGHLNVALFLSDAYLEVPFLEKNTGLIAASVRQSYPNYTLLRLYPDAVPADAKYASYQDGQLKLKVEGTNHEVTGLIFGARDILKYTKAVASSTNDNYSSSGALGDIGGNIGSGLGGNTNSDSRPPVDLDRSFYTEGVKYTYRQGGVFRNTLLAELSIFREDFKLDFRSPFTGETIFGFNVQNSRREERFRDDAVLAVIPDTLTLNAGVETTYHRWEESLSNFSPRRSVNPNTPAFVDVINDLVDNNRTFRALYDGDRTTYRLSGSYVEAELEGGGFRFTPGVRVEYLDLSQSTGVGPRAGLEYSMKDTGTSFLAAAGRHFNAPPTLESISEEAGNPNLEMEEADHTALGFNQKIGKTGIFKLELFRNDFRSLVVEDQLIVEPWHPRTNKRDMVERQASIARKPFESLKRNYSNDGTGTSRGFEIFLQKTRPAGESGLFGWISYTRSLTKRNNHQPRLTRDQQNALNTRNASRTATAYGEFGPYTATYYDTGELDVYYDNDKNELYDLDRDHQLSFVANWKFNAQWQIGARFRYSTGTPFTPIIGNEQVAATAIPTFIPKYSDRYNSERLTPFHQLDIRLDRFLNYEWGYANYYVEIINAYAHKNQETANYNFLRPYVPGYNPAPQYESTYVETPVGGGRVLLLPLINVGIEVKF